MRQKILFTSCSLAIYRIGFSIPLPFVDQASMQTQMAQAGGALGQVLGFVSMFSGGNLSQPPSSASASCRTSPRRSFSSSSPPSIRRWRSCKRKDETGQKKINEYTRYATVVSACSRRSCTCSHIMGSSAEQARPGRCQLAATWYYWSSPSVLTMTAGTIFLMWLGEQIDEYGIGNGISLIIMAGIVARMPDATKTLFFDDRPLQSASVFTLGGGSGRTSASKS